jgi:hypothetical protein
MLKDISDCINGIELSEHAYHMSCNRVEITYQDNIYTTINI